MKGKELVDCYQKIWDEFEETQVNNRTRNNSDRLLKRGFVFQFDEDIVNPDVLYLGINPSYNGAIEASKFYAKQQASTHSYFKSFSDTMTRAMLKFWVVIFFIMGYFSCCYKIMNDSKIKGLTYFSFGGDF